MEKNKICFVAPVKSKFIGGISIWFKHITSKLLEEEYCVIDNSFPFSFKSLIYKYFRHFYSIFRTIRQKHQLKKFINDGEVKILHIASSGGMGFLRDFVLFKYAKKQGLKCILHLHYGKLKEDYSNISFKGRCCKKTLLLSDHIIVLGNGDKTFLNSEGFENVSLINNPVVLQKNKYNSQAKQIIFVGHVIPTKGVFELVDAFNLFKRKKAGFHLKIIGPIDKDCVEEIVSNKDIQGVEICGEMSHEAVLREISISSCLVLPSYTEGMPNVILEAMSLSIPVIATDVGGIKSMIEGCGYLIPPKNTEAIFLALKEFYSNENNRNAFSLNCNSNIKDNYDLDKIFNQLNAVWYK